MMLPEILQQWLEQALAQLRCRRAEAPVRAELETHLVEQYQALLAQGLPPAEAALEVGFADQSHFNHFFKILTGLTPSQYRAVFAAERGEP